MSLKNHIEALLFLTDKPIKTAVIARTLNQDVQDVRKAMIDLINDYEDRNGAIEIADEDGYMMQVKDEFSGLVDEFAPFELPTSLVRTLSAIAIKQPVSQSEVIKLRGAGAYDHIKELLIRELIHRKEDGRSPILTTTKKFQEYFRLSKDGQTWRHQLETATNKDRSEEEQVIVQKNVQLELFEPSPESGAGDSGSKLSSLEGSVLDADTEAQIRDAVDSDVHVFDTEPAEDLRALKNLDQDQVQDIDQDQEQDQAAILVAGGSGTRFGGQPHSENVPKQFLTLNGYRLYIWSLSKLYRSNIFRRIVVTCPARYVAEIKAEVARLLPGSIFVISGGGSRQESVKLALDELDQLGKPDFVVVHDAARPFLSNKTINDAVATVTTLGACTVATPIGDTLKMVDGQKICQTINRENLFAVQTPQAAPFELLHDCHRQAAKLGHGVTDDAAILEHFGHEVLIFLGSNNNLKVTVLDDLRACELLAPLFLDESP